MSDHKNKAGLLDGYRVIDLCEGWYMFAGKILADLGAEVIKIERPGGSTSRDLGPFYEDKPDPEKSLFWFAYNTNKKGITLNIEKADGQEIFKKLVEKIDILFESGKPGYMKSLGLDYSVLSKINPKLIMVSTSGYGQEGPYAGYESSDLTTWAMGGHLYNTGFQGKAPLWFGYPQSSLVASAHAASAATMAIWHKNFTGRGQYVDVSEQQSVVWLTYCATMIWDLTKRVNMRQGDCLATPSQPLKLCFPCRDGHVCLLLFGGGNMVFANSSKYLVAWMAEENAAPQWLKDVNWVTDYDASKLNPDLLKRVNAEVEAFLLKKTKAELYAEGFKRRILIAPINNVKDIAEDQQLQTRGFWQPLGHPGLGKPVNYCGAYAKVSVAPIELHTVAPAIGQDNNGIYTGLLGIPAQKIESYKKQGVI